MNGPDYAALFCNTLIEPGEYLAKLVCVQQFATTKGKTIYQVEVVLDYNEKPGNGTRLSAILQPTTKGQRFIDAFLVSYRTTAQTVQQAVGRFAGVYIYQSEYKVTHFAVVKFHQQPFLAQEKVAVVEAEVSENRVKPSTPATGIIEWNDIPSA